jgi:pSer/pThr/pTyr-binding forkhead associated (FHA) protein
MLRSRKGRVWELEALFAAAQGGLVRVGRAVDNTLSLASHLGDSSAALTLSRRHAALRVDAGQLQLQDSATLNGTFVNDQRLPANAWKVLNEGDTFSLGG